MNSNIGFAIIMLIGMVFILYRTGLGKMVNDAFFGGGRSPAWEAQLNQAMLLIGSDPIKRPANGHNGTYEWRLGTLVVDWIFEGREKESLKITMPAALDPKAEDYMLVREFFTTDSSHDGEFGVFFPGKIPPLRKLKIPESAWERLVEIRRTLVRFEPQASSGPVPVPAE